MHAPHGDPVEGEADMYKLGGTLLLADLPISVLFRRRLQAPQVIISRPGIILELAVMSEPGYQQCGLPHAIRQ